MNWVCTTNAPPSGLTTYKCNYKLSWSQPLSEYKSFAEHSLEVNLQTGMIMAFKITSILAW